MDSIRKIRWIAIAASGRKATSAATAVVSTSAMQPLTRSGDTAEPATRSPVQQAHTGTFEAAILKAANLGDNADRTAAICGQVAGAFYGESGIPQKWLDKLVMREEISRLADRLSAAQST